LISILWLAERELKTLEHISSWLNGELKTLEHIPLHKEMKGEKVKLPDTRRGHG
jgi:hypothetical protein